MAFKDTVARLNRARDQLEDAERIVETWRSAVSTLYDEIEVWLAPYIADQGIRLARHLKSAHEERTGDYEIEMLDIDVGPETVRLDPRGAIVIGAQGRIDMSLLGRGEPMILILREGDDGSYWAVVGRSSRTTVTPLSKETFETTLETMLDGAELSAGPAM